MLCPTGWPGKFVLGSGSRPAVPSYVPLLVSLPLSGGIKPLSNNLKRYRSNGFSSGVDQKAFNGPDPLWRDVLLKHAQKPIVSLRACCKKRVTPFRNLCCLRFH